MLVVCLITNTAMQYVDLAAGGLLPKSLLFIAIMGVGGMINMIYLLIEPRIAPERIGAAMVLLMTIANITSVGAPQIAYLP